MCRHKVPTYRSWCSGPWSYWRGRSSRGCRWSWYAGWSRRTRWSCCSWISLITGSPHSSHCSLRSIGTFWSCQAWKNKEFDRRLSNVESFTRKLALMITKLIPAKGIPLKCEIVCLQALIIPWVCRDPTLNALKRQPSWSVQIYRSWELMWLERSLTPLPHPSPTLALLPLPTGSGDLLFTKQRLRQIWRK